MIMIMIIAYTFNIQHTLLNPDDSFGRRSIRITPFEMSSVLDEASPGAARLTPARSSILPDYLMGICKSPSSCQP
ncbi:uncharacterized protein KY384_006432 [Bacidia gigantensis]|uniref:uncharacterized protein n=1 Tax=Bacidia gigantensis TaxID=2732470 RepID=UPI001D03C738|nr:uncharacterized protein KY384_006432 [Bacidia gigantensis]KAG8528745.1 hypothetical protein KY384_006432 [Bacidia gigantensis]